MSGERLTEVSWPYFVEIVNVVSQVAMTLIAGFGAWVAYQTLLRTPVQEAEPEEPEAPGAEAVTPQKVKVFETSNQTTWLKVTNVGLECHLEDARPNKPGGLQWRFTKEQAREVLSARDFRVYPGYKLYSGVFTIGPRRNWLYSKRLYPEPALLELEIERLLRDAST